MKARANAAKKLLHDNFNINNNRMDSKPGTQYDNPSGRRVDVKITGTKL